MSDQMLLFDNFDVDEDDFTPDGIVKAEEYSVRIFRPQPRHFNALLQEVDAHFKDLTDHSAHQFAVVPPSATDASGPARQTQIRPGLLGLIVARPVPKRRESYQYFPPFFQG